MYLLVVDYIKKKVKNKIATTFHLAKSSARKPFTAFSKYRSPCISKSHISDDIWMNKYTIDVEDLNTILVSSVMTPQATRSP